MSITASTQRRELATSTTEPPEGPVVRRRSRRHLVLAWLAFVAITGSVASTHEMWRDELQHWGIAVESRTPFDVVRNVRYESSPPLWHLGLYSIARLTHDPVAMQVYHVLLASTAMGVFLACAPFPNVLKILFVFGYFPLFEYGVISRHYVLSELLLFGFLALYPWRGRRGFWTGVFLALQAQTSFFGLILAFAGGAALVASWRSERRGEPFGRASWIGLGLSAIGLVVALLLVIQPPDSSIHVYWDFINPWRALQSATVPWRVLVPLPAPRFEFWNTNLLDTFNALEFSRDWPSLLVQDLLSAGLLLGTFLCLRRKPAALVLFGVVSLGCLAFFYSKKLGYMRHHGHVYLAWIGAFWLRMAPGTDTRQQAPETWPRHVRLLTAILVANVLAAVVACHMEIQYRFSAARDAARWIQEHALADEFLIAPPSIGALLDRDVLLLPNQRLGRFHVWRSPWKFYDGPELMDLMEQIERSGLRRCVLIPTNLDLRSPDAVAGLKRLAAWTDCLEPSEGVVIYARPQHRSSSKKPRHSRAEAVPR